MNWSIWKQHFENNVLRPLPEMAVPVLPESQHRALLQSLAKFQLGESGEGRIAHEIDRTALSGVGPGVFTGPDLAVDTVTAARRLIGPFPPDPTFGGNSLIAAAHPDLRQELG